MGRSGRLWEQLIVELSVIPREIIQQIQLHAGQEPCCWGGSSLLPKIQSRGGVMGTIPVPAHKQQFAVSF